jgi:hypothetical protein
MNRATVAAFLLSALVASIAEAQITTDAIVLGETVPGSCEIVDNQPGIRTVNVFHHLTLGAQAVRFRVAAQAGNTMSYVGDTTPFALMGNSQSGVAICYGSCLAPDDIPILTITYLSFGTSTQCAQFAVLPHEDADVGCRSHRLFRRTEERVGRSAVC